MIGTDQSQLKTFVNNPKPTRNILLPGPLPFPSQLTTPSQVTMFGKIFPPDLVSSLRISADHHERSRELSRVNFGWIKRVAGGCFLLLMFGNNALYFV